MVGFGEDLGKEGGGGLFDVKENGNFGGVFDTRKRRNVKFRSEYRRVRKYFKGTKRYWEERSRRKRVLELSGSLTYREIAERLGVSERTVKRDMARIKPYYLRQVQSCLRRLEQERNAEFEARLEGKSLFEQCKILKEIVKDYRKRVQAREYSRHHMVVTVDLDTVVDGFPAVKFWPAHSTVEWALPLTVSCAFLKNKETKPIGSITFQSKKANSIFGSNV